MNQVEKATAGALVAILALSACSAEKSAVTSENGTVAPEATNTPLPSDYIEQFILEGQVHQSLKLENIEGTIIGNLWQNSEFVVKGTWTAIIVDGDTVFFCIASQFLNSNNQSVSMLQVDGSTIVYWPEGISFSVGGENYHTFFYTEDGNIFGMRDEDFLSAYDSCATRSYQQNLQELPQPEVTANEA